MGMIINPASPTLKINPASPKLSMGSLMKDLVLDMPLNSKRYNPGNSKFDDLTPHENRGTNVGGDVNTYHTTFIAVNGDVVRISDSPSLNPTVAMTAMIWVKGAAQNTKGIFCKYDYGNNRRSFYIRTNYISPNNKVQIYVSDDGTGGAGSKKQYVSNVVAFDGTWHLIGFSFGAGTLKLYVDGVEDASPSKEYDDSIITIYNSTADITIGSILNSDTPEFHIDSDMARPRMWNRALTAAEWLLEYDKTKGLYL